MAVFDKEAIHYDQWYKSKLGNFVDKVETRHLTGKNTCGMFFV